MPGHVRRRGKRADGSTMVELLKHSDTAMYQAKDRGRNNVQMFSSAMNRKLKQRVAVEASLREALRLKQLDVHYQPFINLLTRKVVGLEALMRWHHPVHGMVPADQFIPVAEETGLIVPMGDFVLHRTLQNMSAWRKAGARLVPMSLNIAPAQLQRGELQSAHRNRAQECRSQGRFPLRGNAEAPPATSSPAIPTRRNPLADHGRSSRR